jgi:hypothetical protein
MSKDQIISQLTEQHQNFTKYIDGLSALDFEYAKPNKWSAGQQLEHIKMSVKPLRQALILPKFLLKIYLGKANRPSKTYEQLVARYEEKINLGGTATSAFIPKVISYDQKDKLFRDLMNLVQKLNTNLNNYSEADLDTMIAPHPLLGKVTMREMMYFTIHHVQHHQKLIQKYLTEK